MKTNILIYCLCLLLTSTIGCSSSKDKKTNEIRVLYLGGNSDWQNGRFGGSKTFATEEEYQVSIEKRMDAFSQLLHNYFDSVTVMKAADYTPEMSANYDVTIFDGVPPIMEKREIQYDENGKVKAYIPARYLPDNFNSPAITIGSVGETIGRRYGSKNDWYCLCLDASAHHMNMEHPIFKGPFKTDITLSKQPTPEDAFHYQYYYEGNMPDSIMMWQVQTKGYKTDRNFEIGMVSRPWGYMDSPDTEYISSGVCAKTLDAVAIGRHGNFLTWGFVASPLYMTDEAKVVFANAVAYISQFKEAPIARKYNDRIATREYLKELKDLATKKSYEERVKLNEEFRLSQKQSYDQAKAKQAKGETLNEEDKYWLKNYRPEQVEQYTYADHLKRYQDGLYDIFGENENEYIKYYDENKDYFYGGEGSYELTIDEDAKYWQIPNNDKRLLDKAISALEKGEETDRAKRVLKRYTLCDFETPIEWRKWYDKYNNKMFFTESGGWFFLIDGPAGTPGNDYSICEKRKKVAEAQINSNNQNVAPDANNPVITTAQAKVTDTSTIQVSIEMNILAGFHVYEKVSQSDPYIPLKISFELPEECKLKGETIMPAAEKFGSKGTTIYENKVKFVQFINYTKLPNQLKCKVSYQCCDDHMCMPPQEKELNLAIKTGSAN